VQLHGWKSLDLSYNRFSGGILSDFNAEPSYRTVWVGNSTFNETAGVAVALQNNRLSGRIPSSLVHLQNVSVLGSNLFACNIDKSDLPKHDGDRDNYQCGSDAFNGPFYVALALIAMAYASALYVSYQSHASGAVMELLDKWRLDYEVLPAHTFYVANMSDTLCRIGMWCTALIVVVLVPWYAVASRYFKTYVHQYAWSVSAGLLSGVTPVAIELVLYGGFALLLMVCATGIVLEIHTRERQRSRSSSRVSRHSSQSRASNLPVSDSKPLWQRALVYGLFVLVNMTAVVGVNAAFVTTALTQSNAVLVIAQIVVSVFKLLWNTVCTPFLITRAVHYMWPSEKRSGAAFVMVQVFLALFNNIAIPCLVVAVLSPSCFYGVFAAAPIVNSQYFVERCIFEANFAVCSYQLPVYLTSTFSPQFRYDYQCSSSFITYYAPAFVYLGLAASVAAPMVSVLCLRLLQRAAAGGWWHYVLTCVVPFEYIPDQARAGEHFTANQYFIAQLTYLGILLTFGVVFPPLAVVMCATMLSVAWQTKLSIGRFLHFAREQCAPQLAEAIDRDCKGAMSLNMLVRSVFLIMCFACCFYALFLFDTLGDAEGLSGAYWVLIVMPLFPAVLYVTIPLRRYYDQARAEDGPGEFSDAFSLEMSAVAESATGAKSVYNVESNIPEVRVEMATFNILGNHSLGDTGAML
jgi:hypothetical protein